MAKRATARALGRTWVSVLAFGAILFSARGAFAGPRARLVYTRNPGAEACADEKALRDAVAARIGYDPFFPYADRTVVVAIEARGDHLAARIDLVDDQSRGQGARVIEASNRECDALFDTVALTISIAIDPRALVGKPAANEAQTSPPAADEEPAPPLPEAIVHPVETNAPPRGDVDQPQPQPSSERNARSPLRLAAGLRGEVGTVPAPTPAVSLGAAMIWPRVSLGLELSSTLPASKDVDSGGRVRGWLLRSSLVPCFRVTRLALCGVASIGRFSGSGESVTQPEDHGALFLSAGGRASLDVPLDRRFGLAIDAELGGNLQRTTLRVGPDDVWRAPPVYASLGASVFFEF